MSQKQIKSALGRNKNAPQCKKGVGRSPGAGGYAALQNRGRLPRRVYTAVQEGVRPNAGGMPLIHYRGPFEPEGIHVQKNGG